MPEHNAVTAARLESDTDLRTTVLALADADPALSEEAKLAVLDALGDAAAPAAQPAAEPTPAFLKSISVKGFRGVGPEVRVPLRPGPGLVVISGRNGSGKSTVAEALELALTGDSYRWKNRNAVWTDNWRNLHGDGTAGIQLELVEEGSGAITIGLDWAPGADLKEPAAWWQRPGQKRQAGADPLGWSRALDMYRPLLSYDELGGVLDGSPSELFDKLHTLLGLEGITVAGRRLADRTKQWQGPQADLRQRTVALKAMLASSDDPRAVAAASLVAKRKPDLDAVQALAVGAESPRSEPVQALHRLAGLNAPGRDRVTGTATRLRTAVAELAATAGTVVDRSSRQAELLDAALALHGEHGDQSCPVCRVGTLDADWAERTRIALEEDRAARAALTAVRTALAEARRDARSLVDAVSKPIPVAGFDLPELADAAAAHQMWIATPEDDRALADHLDGAIGPVAESYAALRERATTLIVEHEDRWTPIALALGEWVRTARQAEAAAPELAVLKQAAQWLKTNESTLRNQRIAPLAQRARHIWATLRQESNVDLGEIRLEGAATRRRVELRASVDGAEAGALGVMSQGELHALALALFLPRAAAPASPFRFVVLDDPIQAMDPSKVEGFVQVMAELAADRQVIVLSHDDRLADAVRRSSLQASMYEVTRGARSVVSVRETLHPALRYLQDASALTRDPAVPEAAKQRVLPGLFRMAFESAAYEVYARQAHGQGVPRSTVESHWDDARTLQRRLTLALRNQSDGQTMSWVNGGSARSRAFHVCNSGVHGGVELLPDDIKAVASAIKDLRGTAA